MIIDEIYTGSYKGAEFRIKSSSVKGGAKLIKHKLPNSSKQNMENLGPDERSYSFTAFISEPNYTQKKNKLLAALEQGGTGLLVHPFFGNIENIVASSWSLVEDMTSIGEASFSLSFEVSSTDGLPSIDTSSKSIVSASNFALQESIEQSIVDYYSVTFPNVFTDVEAMLGRSLEYFDDKTKIISKVSSSIDYYSGLVSDFADNKLVLVGDVYQLVSSVSTLYATVNGLYSSYESSFEVFRAFFDFDDDLTPTPDLVTASIIEKDQNRAVMKSYMQAAALGYAYENAANIEYDTVDDLNSTASILEAQFDKVSQQLTGDQLSALSDLRTNTQSLFDGIKLNVNQVITVKAAKVPARVLAFTYYGNDDFGENIVNLNENDNVSFFEGDIKVLSS